MGLFEKVGRRFEQFKQEASDAAEEQAEYECEACEKRLFTAHDTCPECGAEAVVPIESGEEAEAEDTTTDKPDATSKRSDEEPSDDGQTPTDT